MQVWCVGPSRVCRRCASSTPRRLLGLGGQRTRHRSARRRASRGESDGCDQNWGRFRTSPRAVASGRRRMTHRARASRHRGNAAVDPHAHRRPQVFRSEEQGSRRASTTPRKKSPARASRTSVACTARPAPRAMDRAAAADDLCDASSMAWTRRKVSSTAGRSGCLRL